jgi:hypothetical protein
MYIVSGGPPMDSTTTKLKRISISLRYNMLKLSD